VRSVCGSVGASSTGGGRDDELRAALSDGSLLLLKGNGMDSELTIPEEAVEAAMRGWCDFHNRYEGVDGAYQAHDEPERSAVTAALTAAYPHLHAREYALSALRVQAENERLRAQIQRALNELGVPGPGYPAPVANAVDILASLSDEGGDDG
jgi:hypothetical protein